MVLKAIHMYTQCRWLKYLHEGEKLQKDIFTRAETFFFKFFTNFYYH